MIVPDIAKQPYVSTGHRIGGKLPPAPPVPLCLPGRTIRKCQYRTSHSVCVGNSATHPPFSAGLSATKPAPDTST
eukprot:640092-Rhodomonas_salina.3